MAIKGELLTLGERIKAARQARGWTREMLAVYSRVSATTVGRVERGDHVPRASVLIALAQALELPVEELAAEAGLTIHLPDPDDKWA